MKPLLLMVALFLLSCGGDEIGTSTLSVAWEFLEGDCDSNGVASVRVTITPNAGDPRSDTFACEDGQGDLGEIEKGGSYGVMAEGLDENGNVLVQNFGQTASFPDGRAIGPIDVTLRPSPGNVIVTWNGCPTGVVIPFFITLYNPPQTEGGPLTDDVTNVQESCGSGTVTIENVDPGEYVVEIDSRAVAPMVRGTADVVVTAGQDAEVNIDVP